MNSRHPGPRRVWKVGSVARWLTPLPRDPAHCTKRWFRVRETILFPPRRHSNLSLAKAWPEAAQWAPKGPQGHPKGAQGHPRGAKEAESRPKGTPKGAQSHPRGAKGTPKSPQREPREPNAAPKEATGTPKTPMGSHKDKIYI